MSDEGLMSFPTCLEEILMGSRVRRTSWPDDGTFLVMPEEVLMIFTPSDGKLHPLKVSSGDILGNDWVVITEKS